MKKYQLPKVFAEKWVKRIREYGGKRSTATLFDGKCFCVLGLAGLVVGIPENKMFKKPDFHTMGNCQKLPEIMQFPVYRDGTLVNIVSGMSDKRKPFSKIADWIEANVEFI